MELEDLAARYRSFAEHSAGDYAPTYRSIVAAVAEDPELLSVVDDAGPAASHPGLLLGSVRFLLADEGDHPLAIAYASRSAIDVVEPFRSFMLDHRDELLSVMSERRLQTNEVARSAVLAPALVEVQRRHQQPLALIDVGASAGFNLLVDQVHIDYDHTTIGPVDSPLHLACTAVSQGPSPGSDLRIGWRAGIDRHPININDPDDTRWLEACVWPDHLDRLERLRIALSLAKSFPARITRGDAVDDLPQLLEKAPADHHLTVATSWVLFYLDRSRRQQFENVLAESDRPLSWVSYEQLGVVQDLRSVRAPTSSQRDMSAIGLVFHPGQGSSQRELLAWAHNHGAWLDWPND